MSSVQKNKEWEAGIKYKGDHEKERKKWWKEIIQYYTHKKKNQRNV